MKEGQEILYSGTGSMCSQAKPVHSFWHYWGLQGTWGQIT